MAEFEEKLNALLSNPEQMAQVMQMAQSLSAGMEASEDSHKEERDSAPSARQPQDGPRHSSSAPALSGDALSSLGGLLGGMDPKLLSRLLPLVKEMGSSRDSEAAALLHALRPFLKPERQEQVERALQLAKLIHVAKTFFANWEV